MISKIICANLKDRNGLDPNDTLVNNKKNIEHQAYNSKIILSNGLFYSVWN